MALLWFAVDTQSNWRNIAITLRTPPTPTGAPLTAASVNQLVTNFNVSRAYFGVGLFNSRVAGRSTLGTNFYVGRPIGSHIEVNCNYFESRPEYGSLTTILSGTVRETLSQRFSLLQLVSRSNASPPHPAGSCFRSSGDGPNLNAP
jgi:hypothetical protein